MSRLLRGAAGILTPEPPFVTWGHPASALSPRTDHTGCVPWLLLSPHPVRFLRAGTLLALVIT